MVIPNFNVRPNAGTVRHTLAVINGSNYHGRIRDPKPKKPTWDGHCMTQSVSIFVVVGGRAIGGGIAPYLSLCLYPTMPVFDVLMKAWDNHRAPFEVFLVNCQAARHKAPTHTGLDVLSYINAKM
jgi:hypothetical protein